MTYRKTTSSSQNCVIKNITSSLRYISFRSPVFDDNDNARYHFLQRQWMNCVNIKSGLWKVFFPITPFLNLARRTYVKAHTKDMCGKSLFLPSFESKVSTRLHHVLSFWSDATAMCYKRIGSQASTEFFIEAIHDFLMDRVFIASVLFFLYSDLYQSLLQPPKPSLSRHSIFLFLHACCCVHKALTSMLNKSPSVSFHERKQLILSYASYHHALHRRLPMLTMLVTVASAFTIWYVWYRKRERERVGVCVSAYTCVSYQVLHAENPSI